MRQSSFISSSKARAAGWRYVGLFFAFTGCVLVANVAASTVAIQEQLLAWHFSSLFDYQTRKLEKGASIDVLLVGDSSLGNAIDAAAWRASLGSEVVNVALTGVYGYAGSLQMLKRAHKGRGVKAALIMQSVDMMARPVSHEGILFSSQSITDVLELPPHEVMPWLVSSQIPVSMLKRLLGGAVINSEEIERSDYIPQGPALTARDDFDPIGARGLTVDRVNTQKILYLGKMREYCTAEGIECVYAHGPVLDSICESSAGYLAKANQMITATGFDILPGTPICLQAHEVGDSTDHVAPRFKTAISERYRHAFLMWQGGTARQPESADRAVQRK